MALNRHFPLASFPPVDAHVRARNVVAVLAPQAPLPVPGGTEEVAAVRNQRGAGAASALVSGHGSAARMMIKHVPSPGNLPKLSKKIFAKSIRGGAWRLHAAEIIMLLGLTGQQRLLVAWLAWRDLGFEQYL